MTENRNNKSGGARLAALALAMVIGGGVILAPSAARQASAQSVTGDQPERGMTRPKHEPKLSFYSPGVVAKLNVEEGQTVKAGDVLAIQDSRAEEAELIEKQGDLVVAQLQVKASDADLKAKRLDLKRKNDMYEDRIKEGKSSSELEQAIVAVEIGEIAVQYRQGEVEKAQLGVKAAELKKDLRKLVSPVDGHVTKIDVKVGEGSDLSKPAVQVVQTDTLYVEADVPVAKAKSLKVGDTLQVAYVDEKDKWMPGKVIFLTQYANAGSGTRKVRLEMPNEGNREAGLAVFVQLKKPETAAAGK